MAAPSALALEKSPEIAPIYPTTDRRDIRMRLREKTDDELESASASDYVDVGLQSYTIPYKYHFTMTCKSRWAGLKIKDVFEKEFQHSGEDYWDKEFRQGRIFVNGKQASPDTKWHDSTVVEHVVHRHESAVLKNEELKVIGRQGDLIAVSKPPSMPIHPCGTYRKNCLQFRLAAFLNLRSLFVVHRLDKETSGVVIFATSKAGAMKFCTQMQAGNLEKRYIAQVSGVLTEKSSFDINHPLRWVVGDFKALVDEKNGKQARTRVKLRRVSGNFSIVEACPITGRSHQIRAHLAAIGHPIVGDVLYGGLRMNKDVEHPAKIEDLRNSEVFQNVEELGKKLNCSTCPRLGNERMDKCSGNIIHLHAEHYSCGDEWAFEAPSPPWARQQPQDPILTHPRVNT